MANPAFMSIQGVTQGNITAGAGTEDSVGNLAISDHPDESRIIQIDHSVIVPFEPSSGTASGQRVHQPFRVHKIRDKATALLKNALTYNEVLEEVVISHYRQSAVGKLEKFYVTTLKQAQIVEMTSVLANVIDETVDHLPEYDIVGITYATISEEHVVASTTYEDSYREVGV